ncbi:MAG: MraY family glycosyltransferase [Pseudomonadota bacterium]|nr:MraY family glycosyltransferase [Pseudomonadota bacterium]MEC7995280.1 MraY family glycosyltransferase [Pseudomonadota bacterium]
MQLPFKPIPMIVVAGLSSLVGGALGVLLLMLMLLLTQASLGREEADKHGISENNASRMGGVAIAVGALMFCIPAVLTHSSVDLSKAPANLFRGYEWAPLLIGMIGLVDDITQRISPMNRLLTMLLVVVIAFLMVPEILPKQIDFLILSKLLNEPLLMTVAATIVVVGFVNAGNIADGANGLLAIIALCVFYLAHQHTQSALFFGLFVSVAVFTLYNLASGRIFLGDFGSYGLSAMMAFACLDLLTISDASIWFFAAILSYPCTELVRVITNRLLRNRSPFAADNSHVHNKLFTLLKKTGLSSLVANSATGLVISGLFSVLPTYLAVSGVLPWNSSLWFLYFSAGVIVHLALSMLSRQGKVEQHYADGV